MPELGDLLDLGGNVAATIIPDIPGVGGVPGIGSSGGRKGPIRGARLEYNIPALGGRLLIKEPFGKWFNLNPVYPEYSAFESGDNRGKKFTKRAGFRFKSYTILLKPGTKIQCPKAKAADQRKRNANTGTEEVQIGNISIGVSANVNVREFIEWLKSSNRKDSINGVISPTLRKYQWGGILHRVSNSGSGNGGVAAPIGIDIPGTPLL